MRLYLKSRTQRVKLNQEWSSALGCNVGVPQGAILGPRLFSLDMNNSLKLAEELISKCMQMTLLFMTQQVHPEKVMTDMWQHVKLCHLMWKLLNGLVNEMYLIRKTWLTHIFQLIIFNLTRISIMHFQFKICFYFKMGREEEI